MCTSGARTQTQGDPAKLQALMDNNPLKARGMGVGRGLAAAKGDSFTPILDVEAGNVSDLYRKNYDKKAAMSRMRTMGASADPKVVRRMLANARGVDEKHYKAMLKAYNEANDPSFKNYHPAKAMMLAIKRGQ